MTFGTPVDLRGAERSTSGVKWVVCTVIVGFDMRTDRNGSRHSNRPKQPRWERQKFVLPHGSGTVQQLMASPASTFVQTRHPLGGYSDLDRPKLVKGPSPRRPRTTLPHAWRAATLEPLLRDDPAG